MAAHLLCARVIAFGTTYGVLLGFKTLEVVYRSVCGVRKETGKIFFSGCLKPRGNTDLANQGFVVWIRSQHFLQRPDALPNQRGGQCHVHGAHALFQPTAPLLHFFYRLAQVSFDGIAINYFGFCNGLA